MLEIFAILIGIGAVVLGFPIGNFLAWISKDEIKTKQNWFKTAIILFFIGAIIFLALRNDAFFFSFLFFAAVTSRSLKKK